jgi:hypothetical protein
VLFSGSVRFNLDPQVATEPLMRCFCIGRSPITWMMMHVMLQNSKSESALWEVLERVHLDSKVRTLGAPTTLVACMSR